MDLDFFNKLLSTTELLAPFGELNDFIYRVFVSMATKLWYNNTIKCAVFYFLYVLTKDIN